MDLGEVGAKNAIKGGPHIERRGIDLIALGSRLRQCRNITLDPDAHSCDCRLELAIAFLSLVQVKSHKGRVTGSVRRCARLDHCRPMLL